MNPRESGNNHHIQKDSQENTNNDIESLQNLQNQEIYQLAGMLSPLKDSLYMAVSGTSDMKRYNDSYLDSRELAILHNEQAQKIRESNGDNAEIVTSQMIKLAIGLSLLKRIKIMRSIESKYGDSNSTERAFALRAASLTPATVVRINGMSVEDISQNGKEREIRSPELFFHVVSTGIAATSRSSGNIDKEQPYPLNDFPATRDLAAYSSAIQLFSIGFLGDLVKEFSKHPRKGLLREFSDNLTSLSKKLNTARTDVLKSLQDPGSEDFVEVAVGIAELIDKYPDHTYLIFRSLKLDNDLDITNFYRKLVENSDNQDYGEFYRRLADLVKEDIESLVPNSIPSVDNQDMFLKSEGFEEEFTIPDFSSTMREIAGRQGLLPKQYEIDPKTVNLEDLVTPSKVLFGFGEKSFSTITVRFVYENEEAEESFIDFYGDTKKNEYDWNFLEKPDTAPYLWKNVSRGALSIFQVAKEDILKIAEQKRSGKKEQLANSGAKREYSGRDEIYDLRKEARRKVSEAFEMSALETLVEKNNKVRNSVVIEGIEEADALFRMSFEDKKELLEELKAKNEDGSLNVSKLKKAGRDGTERFVYRARISGEAVRVLLRMTESDEPGVRKFEVVRAGYRKDAYRDENLE